MADVEARKILSGLWANTGDRTDPDDTTLDPVLTRANGWPTTFSSSDGNTPRRRVMNQKFREWDGIAAEVMREGILPWDATIDYRQYAIAKVEDVIYRATIATGPGTSNATNPTQGGQTVWTVVRGEFTLPSAPAAPTATSPRAGVLDWQWNPPLDGGRSIIGFDFEWRVGSTGLWQRFSPRPTATCVTLTGLTNGQAIQARVRTETSEGTSGWSAVGTGTAQAEEPGGGATFALRAEPGNSQVTLTWLEPDSNGASLTTYHLQWRSSAQSFSSGRQVNLAAGVVRHTLSTGISNGVQYFFRIRAVNARGNGGWSNEASATPSAPAQTVFAPSRATNPTGQPGNGRATWIATPPSDRGAAITSYIWRWRRVGQVSWSNNVTTTIPALTVTSLTNGQAYEAQVRATNTQGSQSSWSPSGTATPSGDPPDQFQRVFVVNTTTGLSIHWGAPEANGAALIDYRIEMSTQPNFSSPTVWTVGTSVLNQDVTGVRENTTYYVRGRARNSEGSAPWSASVALLHELVHLADVPDPPDAPMGR